MLRNPGSQQYAFVQFFFDIIEDLFCEVKHNNMFSKVILLHIGSTQSLIGRGLGTSKNPQSGL